ncbi:MAG: Gfo/Idh/MocA family oxidoreductase [Planctomycetales bacterium]|nr:Gfo/Idh/MocA family oxidoreductase [Planctomycetales bacterium]
MGTIRYRASPAAGAEGAFPVAFESVKMAASPLRVCLVGLGRAGKFHLQSLRMMDDAVLCCVCDADEERSRAVAEDWGCDAASPEAGISRSDVDAVIVATPTQTHFGFVNLGLDAGKPVFTEKPLGSHLREIDACFEKAAGAKLPLFVGFQRRFDPSFASLVRSVHDHTIGELQFVRSVSRDNPVPSSDYIRDSGGIFHDCLVHDLDMLVHLFRRPPEQVSAFGGSFIPEISVHGDYDNVVVALSFGGGAVASIDINRKSVYGYDQRIEAFGDLGMVQADNRPTTTVATADVRGVLRPCIEYSFPTRYREAYLAELQCFVRCVRGEEATPITHEDVRTNFLLACACETAAREQRVVRLEEVEPGLP